MRKPERRVGMVTGGSRGIGSATVRALAAHGFDVAFTYLSRARRAGQVVADVRASGREALAVAGDMTDASALAGLLSTLGAWTDHLDVLRERMAGHPDLRLLVVTGDLVQGTVTPKLLERAARGLTEQRRLDAGDLPTAEEVGGRIAAAALDPSLPSSHTVVIGAELDSLAGS